MQVAAPYCLLCGVHCADPQDCRVADAADVQALVARRCTPTAFHYKSVQALPPAARYPLCMPCVSWRRRAKKKRASAEKGYTPLDG